MLHVAVLAEVECVHLFVGATLGRLHAALLMVTILAHALCVELPIYVLACRDLLLLSNLGTLALKALVEHIFPLSPTLLAYCRLLDLIQEDWWEGGALEFIGLRCIAA